MVRDRANEEKRLLESGVSVLGIDADASVVDSLLEFLGLIRKWSGSYNLVAPGDLQDLVARHILDSLTIQPFLANGPLLDVGTGAGFPGVPLAILNRQLEVTLVDSAGKKIRFLNHVGRSLGLVNIHPVNRRIERFSPGLEFSTITCRAFSSLRAFVESIRHLAGPETKLMAMKGKYPDEELSGLPDWINVASIEALSVPGLRAERHLVMMTVSA